MVLIHSLKLPKTIDAKLESHPLYYDILKDQKRERIVFQDSLIFGKYRCKKAIENIKSKNVDSKLLKHFDELNLCGFQLGGARTDIEDQTQLHHTQLGGIALMPFKTLDVLLDSSGVIQASIYSILTEELKHIAEIKMNMPNGQYLESLVRYDTIRKTFTTKTIATDRIADQFKYEYFITNEKTAELPFADTKLEYHMSENRILLVKERETTEKSNRIECEITITKDDKVIFKKTQLERCF